MSLYGRIARPGPSGFGYGATAEQVTAGRSLAGKAYLLTGCNAGLGRETLRVLVRRGARVFAAARTLARAEAACAGLVGDGSVVPLACELADARSVRACVAAVGAAGASLDGIIANAGIMALPRLETAYGLELQFFVNHVGHFLLITGLVDRLAPDGRVVVLSSEAHRRAPRAGIEWDNLDGRRGYRPWRAYAQSKLANLLFATELARRFAGSGRSANAVHPGVIHTDLVRHMNPMVSLGFALGAPSP